MEALLSPNVYYQNPFMTFLKFIYLLHLKRLSQEYVDQL